MLCSAVQHARHADDRGAGAGGQFTGRTGAVEQFLHRQRDENGGDQHRHPEQKAPSNDSHSNMQHCWCCSGSAPLVALPGHAPQLYFARYESNRSVAPPSLQTPTPRQQWPSLNPRASPLV
ncbi:DUF2946 family protein [Pseudomonas parakoreensis]